MTPDELDEIKAKMQEVDAKVRAAFAAEGFTAEETDRQLDPNVPDEVKKAERETVLKRKFLADLEDPNSAAAKALDRALDGEIGKVETQIAALEAEKRRKRRTRVTAVVAGVVVVAASVWWFALRDARTVCEKLVGPLAEIEAVTHVPLSHEPYVLSHDHYCSDSVGTAATPKRNIVSLYFEQDDLRSYDEMRRQEAARPFAHHELLQTARGEADVFLAGDPKDDVKGPSPEQMMAEAQRRVGTSADPMGDVLAATPPSSPETHVVLIHGDPGTIQLELDRTAFTADQVKAYAKAVAERAR